MEHCTTADMVEYVESAGKDTNKYSMECLHQTYIITSFLFTSFHFDIDPSIPGPNVGATITAHHLLYNRNALFAGGICPHYYCLPILKRERHRQALLKAATSGNPKFFLGSERNYIVVLMIFICFISCIVRTRNRFCTSCVDK